jgi:hypothetical protein
VTLDPDDLARLDALVEERLAQREAERRRRRRRWLVPLLVTGGVLLVAAGVGTWYGVRAGMDWVAARDQELSEAKLAYQRELAQNRAWQATRVAAEKATGYNGRQTQAQHEAALMNQSLQLIAQQRVLSEKWKTLDYDDPKSLEILSDDLGKVLEQGLGTIGQVLLRNSDPAHNTADERRQQEAAGQVVPVDPPLTMPKR